MLRLAIASAVLVSTFALSAEAAEKVRREEQQCRYKGHGSWSNKDVMQGIRCAERRWSVPGGARKAISVARCESGLNPRAYYAGHAGLYQHVTRYWPARFRKYRVRGWHLHRGVYNARSAIVVTMRMVHGGGWSPWSCA